MMKMTKVGMKILYAVLAITIIMSTVTPVFAALTPNDIQPSNVDTVGIKNYAGTILGAVQAIGIAVAVIIIVVIGVKYLMGSAEEKAEYKKTMIPYIVGAALVAGGPTIANAIYTLMPN